MGSKRSSALESFLELRCRGYRVTAVRVPDNPISVAHDLPSSARDVQVGALLGPIRVEPHRPDERVALSPLFGHDYFREPFVRFQISTNALGGSAALVAAVPGILKCLGRSPEFPGFRDAIGRGVKNA